MLGNKFRSYLCHIYMINSHSLFRSKLVLYPITDQRLWFLRALSCSLICRWAFQLFVTQTAAGLFHST